MQDAVRPRASGDLFFGSSKRRKRAQSIEDVPPGAGVMGRTKEDIPEVLEIVSQLLHFPELSATKAPV